MGFHVARFRGIRAPTSQGLRRVLIVPFAILFAINFGDLVDDLLPGEGSRISYPGFIVRGVWGAADRYTLIRDPAGVAKAAGVRENDRLELEDRSPAARLSIAAGNGLPPGTRIAMTDVTGHRPYKVVMRRDEDIASGRRLIISIVELALEAIALLILVQRRRTRQAQAMAIAVFALVSAFYLASGSYLGVWYRVGYHIMIHEAIGIVGFVALADLAITLGDWPRLWARRYLLCAAVAGVLFWSASVAGYGALMLLGRADIMELLRARHYEQPAALMILIAAGAFIISFIKMRSANPRKFGIVGISALLFAAPYLYPNTSSLTGVYDDPALPMFFAGHIVGAIGLGYAILVTHVFEIGDLVVERTLIVAAAAEIGFRLMEWYVTKEISTIFHDREYIEIGVSVAIALILMMFVDGVKHYIRKKYLQPRDAEYTQRLHAENDALRAENAEMRHRLFIALKRLR